MTQGGDGMTMRWFLIRIGVLIIVGSALMLVTGGGARGFVVWMIVLAANLAGLIEGMALADRGDR